MTQTKPIYVHPRWFHHRGEHFLQAFRVMRVSLDQFQTPVIADFDAIEVRAVFGRGQLEYLAGPTLRVVDESRFATIDAGGPKKTADEPFALLATPMAVGVTGEPEARARLDIGSGLLTALLGRNAVYEMSFEQVVNVKTGQVQIFSNVVEAPNAFPAPDLGRLGRLASVNRALGEMTVGEQNRLSLAFRWLSGATRHSGPDAFLRYWIAIETVAMPNTQNIRPVEERLATVYGLDLREVRRRFLVGRLADKRARIIHDGDLTPIHGNLLAYAEAIFVDLMLDVVGAPTEHRAGALLARPDFDLAGYLA